MDKQAFCSKPQQRQVRMLQQRARGEFLQEGICNCCDLARTGAWSGGHGQHGCSTPYARAAAVPALCKPIRAGGLAQADVHGQLSPKRHIPPSGKAGSRAGAWTGFRHHQFTVSMLWCAILSCSCVFPHVTIRIQLKSINF